jgi:hypothetical protein
MKPNYYATRAQAAQAAADAATDPRDKAAYLGAAQTWARLANPVAGGYSMEPTRQQLDALKRNIANAIDAPTSVPEPQARLVESVQRVASRYPAKVPAIIEF